jgi:hypothetical protein
MLTYDLYSKNSPSVKPNWNKENNTAEKKFIWPAHTLHDMWNFDAF